MNQQFIPYEIALELRALGFDEPCLAYYDIIYNALDQNHYGKLVLGKDPDHLRTEKQMLYIFGQQKCLAPLYQQAFKFFRDKYKLNGLVRAFYDADLTICKFDINIEQLNSEYEAYSRMNMSCTYEEAELECIKKLIEIAKK